MDTKTIDRRDRLARDRTHLANERTMLAYSRTGLAFAVSGAFLIKFFPSKYLMLLAFTTILVGLILFTYGIVRYIKLRREIDEI